MNIPCKKLLLFPFNGNAREAASVVEAVNHHTQKWELLGFVDDDTSKHGQCFGNYRVLGGRDVFSHQNDALTLAVPGRPENFQQRQSIINSLGLMPNQFATLVHPAVTIGINCKVGINTLLMANVVLTANVTIGDHVVILPGTVVAHDTIIEDYCLIGSNVSISGGVTLKSACYIGSGSRIIQEVTVGTRALVGLGSVVIRDINPSTVVAGNPATILRTI
jgi:sugar O-acyltransferase (sialic acid O-acetyltransferase NeuD family)